MDRILKLNDYKNLPKTFGVYEIINTTNGDTYVGSSKNIYKRMIVHSGQLRNNKHGNVLLQRSYLKYGHDSFKIIFEVTETEAEARELEQTKIDSGNYRYNLSRVATGGVQITDAVCAYTEEGNFLEEFKSVNECFEKLNVPKDIILNCCIGKIPQYNTLCFRFANQDSQRKLNILQNFLGSDIDWVKYWYSKNYKIYRWDLKSQLIKIYTDINILCKELNVTRTMFRKHLHGRYLTVKGSICTLTDTPPKIHSDVRKKPIVRLDEKGNILERYPCASCLILLEQGYAYTSIYDALTLKHKTNKYKDMFWKYDDSSEFIPMKTEGNKRKVKITITESNELFGIFKTIQDAALAIGIARTSLSRSISMNRIVKKIYKAEFYE